MMDSHVFSGRLHRLELVCWSSALLLMGLLAVSQAQVRSTITSDGSLGTTVTQGGSVFTITGGSRPGNGPNLFHSFDRLTVGTRETASFTGAAGIRNILSRVTGGQPSLIDGTLQSTIPGAHLYLLNPSGVLFGPNARLDLSGSLHVSTADYLRMADGTRFSTRLSDASVLSVAPPEAFGFFGPRPAPITVSGSMLQVPEGATLSLIGGDMTVQPFLASAPKLRTPGGRLHLASVASPGEVVSHPADLSRPLQVNTIAQLGQITLSGGSLLDASGSGGGTVVIRGGRLMVVDNSAVVIHNAGNIDGARTGLDIEVTQDVVVANRAGLITTARSAGRAGDIRLTAGSIEVSNESSIGSRAFADGDAGSVFVTTPSLLLRGGEIAASTSGNGRAGDIHIRAGQLLFTMGGGLFSPSGFEDVSGNLVVGTGAAGNITVTASTVIADGGKIQTSTGGDGRAGDVRLEVGQLILRESGFFSTSGLLDQTDNLQVGTGAAGNITVVASAPVSLERSLISTGTFGGPGGQVTVTTPSLRLSRASSLNTSTGGNGRAGDLQVEVGQLTLEGSSGLYSTSGAVVPPGVLSIGTGAAGNITVVASAPVSLEGSSRISTGTFGGPGGQVTVTTPHLRVDDNSTIITTTASNERGGDIRIQAGRVTLTRGGTLLSNNFSTDPFGDLHIGQGGSGNVTVTATTMVVANGGVIQATTASDGRAGDIVIEVGELTLTEGSRFDSNAGARDPDGNLHVGTGAAGNVTVRATTILVDHGGNIVTSTRGDGKAGDIRVEVGRLTLLEGAQIDSSTFSAGAGGTVTITATDAVSLTSTGRLSAILSNASGIGAQSGHAGTVTLTAPVLMLEGEALIEARTIGDGNAGNVAITVGQLTLSEGAQIGSSSGIVTPEGIRFVGAGAGGAVRVTATEAVTMAGPNSGLSTTTLGAGQGGDILVQAARVQLTDGATMTAQGTGTGDAGRVALTASGAVQGAHSAVTTTATTGAGGVIQITAGTAIDLTETELSATVTGGSRPGGSITLTTPALTMTGGRVAAETQGAGTAGNVTLQAERVTAQGATLTSSSTATATGDAGTITLQGLGGPGTLASRLTLTGSVVATEATVADGGNIALLAQGTLRLRDSQLTTAVRSGTGRGGNILIDPDFVILERSQIRADAFGGPGGNIRLVAKGFLTDAESRVSASSAQSVQGTVAIEAFTTPTGLVAPLPAEFVPLATLLSTRCAARLREGRVGSLLVSGRDGLPADPEGGLPSLPIAGGLATATGSPQTHSVLGRLAPPVPWGTSWPLRLWGGSDADCGPGARW